MAAIDENSNVALEYRGMKKQFAVELAAQINSEIPEFDAVVSPPSSRPDANPYREAVLRDKKVLDLTRCFSRKGRVKIGRDETTLDQAFDELTYQPSGNERDVKSLLIVDESIASGKTVAAVLHHLRGAGLPERCKITVAVWAKVVGQLKPKADGRPLRAIELEKPRIPFHELRAATA